MCLEDARIRLLFLNTLILIPLLAYIVFKILIGIVEVIVVWELQILALFKVDSTCILAH